MLASIKYDVTSSLSRVQVQPQQDVEMLEQQRQQQEAMLSKLQYQHVDITGMMQPQAAEQDVGVAVAEKPFIRTENKVGRNDLCPCGSGKKYKQCHGKLGS